MWFCASSPKRKEFCHVANVLSASGFDPFRLPPRRAVAGAEAALLCLEPLDTRAVPAAINTFADGGFALNIGGLDTWFTTQVGDDGCQRRHLQH